MKNNFVLLVVVSALMAAMLGVQVHPAFAAGPSISLSSTSGAVGTTVNVSGLKFEKNDTISLKFDGNTVTASGTCNTDSKGSFSGCTFVVPSSSGGPKNVEAKDSHGDKDTATFTVERSISLSTAINTVGASVTVTGTGFAASSTITIKYDGLTQSTSPSTVTSSSTGGFTASFTAPASSVGSYNVAATDNTNTSPNVPFTVTAPNAPVITPAPTTPTNDATVAIAGTKDALTRIKVFDTDGITVVADTGSMTVGTTWSLDTSALSDGTHTLTAKAYDSFGNPSLASGSVSVKVDTVAPTISGSYSGTLGNNGWYRVAGSETLTSSDATSGVASITYTLDGGSSHTYSGVFAIAGDGTHTIVATAADNAGNTATTTITIKIDATAPAVAGAATISPNGNGWYNSDVTVHFTASDSGSGINTVTSDATLTTEGSGQSVTGTATDLAGNSASATVGDINIDKTAPAVSGAPAASPNANGWYNENVQVDFTASDSLSGISGSSTASETISTEGSSQSASHSFTDLAGNSASATVSEIKLDKTVPVITGSRTPANSNGWNNDDVTVHFSATDSLSDIDSVTLDTTVSDEGAGQSVIGTATDKAGNSASTTVDSINIDKTAPTVGHTQTPSPNSNGWNNEDVTVDFTATDSLSGIDGSSTASETITTEGADQTASATFTDLAGNSATDLATASIDKTAPTVDGVAASSPNGNGWYSSDVQVDFSATDSLSGIDGSTTASETISTEGLGASTSHTFTDKAGNTGSASVSINLDKTAPTVTGNPTTPANGNGWYNIDVTVEFSATDSLSGVDGADAASETITTEGSDVSASHSFVDLAGNSASGSVSINLDKTAPAISGAAATLPNSNNWYNDEVTISFSATDSGSGIDTVTPDTTLTTEGSGQSVTGTATDLAGNSASATVGDINIDKTSPTITHAQTPTPNANGWNKEDAIVSFTASDALSGIDGSDTANEDMSAEGSNLSTGTYTFTDLAGNSASDSATGINIDKTAPVVTAAAATSPNSNGWYNNDVQVDFSATDSLSGIDGASTASETITTEGSSQSATHSFTDLAGNSASATVSGIKLDKTAPTISGSRTPAPNANGWNKADVTVHFTASDSGSGIDTVSPDTTVTTEGAGQSVTGTATDLAGNSASKTVSGINIDKTVPTITISLPSNNAAIIDSSASVTGTSSDSGSGISYLQVKIDGGGYYAATGTDSWTYSATGLTDGSHTITARAIDKAGNGRLSVITIQVSIPPSSPPSITIDSVSNTTPKWGIDTVTITGSVTDQFVGHDKVTVNWGDGLLNPGILIGSDGSWTASHVYAGSAVDSRSITADVIRTMPGGSVGTVDSTDSPTVIAVQKHQTAILFTTSDVSSTSIKWGKTLDVTDVYLEDADTHTPLARTIRFDGSAVVGPTLGATDSTGHLTSDLTITTRAAAGTGKTLAASFVASPTGPYLSSSATISIDLVKHNTAITTVMLDVPSVARDATFHVTATVLVDIDNGNSQLAGKTIWYSGTAVVVVPSVPTGTTSDDADGLVSDVAITASHAIGAAKTVIATFNGGNGLYTAASATATINITTT